MSTPLLHDEFLAGQLLRVLKYADLRKHLADDEHCDPLPIHGSARMYDRLPLMHPDRRGYSLIERLQMKREQMSKEHAGLLLYPTDGDGYVNSSNPEEGA